MTTRFRTTASALALFTASATIVIGPVAAQNQATANYVITPQEKQQGAEAHPQLLQEFGGAFTGPQAAYVETVGKNVAVHSRLSGDRNEFTVTLLNSPVNNAFAIPGGYIYVTRQLTALMNNEAELAGVLGHEWSHISKRHSQQRQRAATRNGILGVLGQIGSAILLGDSGAGRLAQQVFGQGSQLLTLKYSRTQEYEADDGGVEALRGAGYDPRALSSMLASLGAQSALDARLMGRDGTEVPSWASSHPTSASRVSRALQRAGSSPSGTLNRDIFLSRINGMMYGDDPRQGVVEGRNFIHPDFRMSFQAPTGFYLVNGTRAVSIGGQSGKGELTTAAYNGNMNSYIDAAFVKLTANAQGQPGERINYGEIQRTTVNGIPAAYATGRVASGRNQVDVTVFAYEFSGTQAFHFTTIAAAGQSGAFTPMYNSMRRISAQDAAAVRPRKVSIVTVGRNDTMQTLAGRMAYSDMQMERFLVLNALSQGATLSAGQKVKIITY